MGDRAQALGRVPGPPALALGGTGADDSCLPDSVLLAESCTPHRTGTRTRTSVHRALLATQPQPLSEQFAYSHAIYLHVHAIG